MSIPSTPQELERRIASLDQEIAVLTRKAEELRGQGDGAAEIHEALGRVRSERVRLQFFVNPDVPTGRLRSERARSSPRVAAEPSLRIPRTGRGKNVALVALVAAGVSVSMWLKQRDEPPEIRVEPAVEIPQVEPPQVDLVVPPLPTATAAVPTASPEDALATETLVWGATVTSTTGSSLANGTSCELTTILRRAQLADLSADRVLAAAAGAEQLVIAPQVECGGRLLYAADAAVVEPAGERLRHAYVWERPGTVVGAYELWLQYSDIGERAQPVQAIIDTPGQRILLWRTGANGERIELSVDPWAKRVGEALNVGASPVTIGFLDVKRTGRVVAGSGAVAARAGQPCTFQLIPNEGSRHTCRATVTCAGAMIYGGGTTGYLECGYADGIPTTALDAEADDGDPIFEMNLPDHSVRVASDQPGGVFSVSIALDR